MPSPDDCITLQSWITAVDEAAREKERLWGFDRLRLLASPELRAKFDRQAAKWREALEQAWAATVLARDMLDAVASRSAAMQRGWQALEDAASEAGHRPVAPFIWEVVLKDGTVAAFVQTAAEASKVIADGRHVVVWTVEEVANILNAIPEFLNKAKTEFPGSKIIGTGDRRWLKNGDPIPFGDAA